MLAIALTALTPSVHAVDTTETDVLDYTAQKFVYNPVFQKRYLESDVLTKIALHPYTKPHLDTLLSFAFKCSLLPKDIPLKEKERTDALSKIEEYDNPTFLKNRQLFEDFLNKLDNLDTNEIINHIVSENGALDKRAPPFIDKREMAYELAKDLIPLALHRKKTEEARYFYQQITQRVPEESMRKMEMAETVDTLKYFQAANILKDQFIKNAAQYDNADAIIQTLLGEPYQIKQDDMDCAFWLGFFCSYSPWVDASLNDFFRLFSNPNIKPSLKIVKKTLRACKNFFVFRTTHRHGSKEESLTAHRHGSKEESLTVDFLRFFIGYQATDAEQEQSKFNLKGDLKKLRDNVGKYPELGKALQQIQADFKNRKILEGGDPWMDRVISHEHNIKRENTGEMVARLSKNKTDFKLNGRKLPPNMVDEIMAFADPTASKLIHLPKSVVRRIEENEGRMAKKKEMDEKKISQDKKSNDKKSNEQRIVQKEAEEKSKTQIDSGNNDNTDQHIGTVAPNGDTVKIDDIHEVQIDTMQNSQSDLKESKDSGESQGDLEESKDSREF